MLSKINNINLNSIVYENENSLKNVQLLKNNFSFKIFIIYK